jgi:hypothetical protein
VPGVTAHAPGRARDARTTDPRPAVLPAATPTTAVRRQVRARVANPVPRRLAHLRRSTPVTTSRPDGRAEVAAVTRVPDISAGGIAAQVAAVVDPVARRWRGASIPEVRAVLRRAWWTAFGGPLEDPALTWCAEAVRDGRDWAPALWGTGP